MMNEHEQQTWRFGGDGASLVEPEREPPKQIKKRRANPFVWLFRENPFYLAAFFLPAAILYIAYMFFSVWPAGDRSVLSLDLNGQYVYYFDYIHDVFAGSESIFYSWSRSLSGEFFGIIGYYLASPFNFIVWAFPRDMITEGLLVMILTKVGAIGVCAAVYLRKGRGFSINTAIVFSAMYALSSYVIAQTMNPMWLDGVMVLPLVLMGVEALVRHGRFKLLILSLAYAFITCFYIGYMIGIFSGLYLIYCFFAVRTDKPLDGGSVVARLGLFMIAGAAAVLISAFMLLPVYGSLELGKMDFSVKDYSMRTFDIHPHSLMDMGRKLLPNTYDTVRNDGLPFLYSSLLTVIMLPLFFLGNKLGTISFRKRAAAAVLGLVMVLSMYITPVDMLWHGGQMPNWLPYRYSFILTFLFVAWGAEAFEKLGSFSRRAVGLSAIGVFGLILYFENADTFVMNLRTNGVDGRELFDNITVVLPAILILIVTSLLLLNRKNKIFKRQSFYFILGVVIVLELGFNVFFSLEKQHNDVWYSLRTSYAPHMSPMREKVEQIKAQDEGFYRIEKNFHRTVNDPIALGMYGFSHSSSTLNAKPIELIGKFGLTSRSHYTRYSGATPLFNDIFGVKYILTCRDNNYTNIYAPEDITVITNPTAMPIAYLTDLSLNSLDLNRFPGDNNNVFMRQNRVLSAMLGEPQVNEYIRTIDRDSVVRETENFYVGAADGGYITFNRITHGHQSLVKYTMTAEADGEIFMWLPTGYERRVNIRVNRLSDELNEWGEREILRTEWRGELFEADDYCIKSLGEFREGEHFSVDLVLQAQWNDLFYRDELFGYMDWELYTPAIQRLHEMNADTVVTKISPTNISIATNSDTHRLLLTTIPAEPGWSLYINGQKSEYSEVMGALIGVNLPAGAHLVELKYFPASYPLALILTGGGVIIFILLSLLYSKMQRQRAALESIYGGYEQDEDDDYAENDEYAETDYTENNTPPDDEIIPDDDEIILGDDESIDSIINDFREINSPDGELPLPEALIPDLFVPPILPVPIPIAEAEAQNSYDDYLLAPIEEEQEEIIEEPEIFEEPIIEEVDESMFFAEENDEHHDVEIAEIAEIDEIEELPAEEEEFFAEEAEEILTDEAKVFAATTALEPEEDDTVGNDALGVPFAENDALGVPFAEDDAPGVPFAENDAPEYIPAPGDEAQLEYVPEPEPAEEEELVFEKREEKNSELPAIDFEARKKALEMELMAQTIRKAELEVGLLSQQLAEEAVGNDALGVPPAENNVHVVSHPEHEFDNSYGEPPPPEPEEDYTPMPDYGYFEFGEEEQVEQVEHFNFDDDPPPNSL